MNTRAVNAAAGVIRAAVEQGRTPAGIALSLDAAGLLQSPETAAEFEALRKRVAELDGVKPCGRANCHLRKPHGHAEPVKAGDRS